ncbi:MAG: hypothetical protein K5981_08995 [Clostridia bacterium]|nr:hypothetical protein [Clostridia bacterium]
MSDKTLLIVGIILELLALYNLWDTASTMYMHLSSKAKHAQGTIAKLKKAMRRDRVRLMVPTNRAVDSREVPCDYLMDMAYEREDGELVLIKDLIVPSVMKLTAGSASSIYREGQMLPLRYSEKLKKLAVVDMPEVRNRQVSWVWLILWIFSSIAIAALMISTILAL